MAIRDCFRTARARDAAVRDESPLGADLKNEPFEEHNHHETDSPVDPLRNVHGCLRTEVPRACDDAADGLEQLE
jgi:hypothetical protein